MNERRSSFLSSNITQQLKMFEQPNISYINNEYIPNGGCEMSAYTNIPTPPMSGSEGSRSPQVYYQIEYNGTQIVPDYYDMTQDENAVHLQILEQPVEKFRFRYKSEMAGTHGSLNGVTSDKNRKQTFPTVRLRNYSGPAVIRCALYQYNPHLEEDRWQPHAHRLVQKRGSLEVDDPHDKKVSEIEEHVAVFNNMGIIHTAKKYLVSELMKKKTKLLEESIKRKEGRDRNLKIQEESDLTRSATDESKCINLNIVCLRFDAFKEEHGILKMICPPIYTHPINNLKSALTGELKIVRIDRCKSRATGGNELFLLVEKVTKKNIKVRFFELDEDENEVWSDYGKFNDIDVHHQYAIVLRSPPYKNVNIESNKKVFIELERPSDGAKSAPLEFEYFPDPASRRKRPRTYDSSSSSFSSCELPSMLTELGFIDPEVINQTAQNVGSEEFRSVLKEFYEKDCNIDIDAFKKSDITYEIYSKEAQQPIARFFGEIKSFLKTNPSEARIVKMFDKWIQKESDSKGNNALHLTFMYFEHFKDSNFLENLVHLIIKCKQTELLNIPNKKNNTILHLAVLNDNYFLLETLINVMDLTTKNSDGYTVLHLTILNNGKYDDILKSTNVKNFIDIENYDNYTAIQMAVQKNNLDAVKALYKAGADYDVIDKKTGGNLIHLCISCDESRLEIVEYLVNNTEINIMSKNHNGDTCQMMVNRSNAEYLKDVRCVIEDKLRSLGIFEACYIKEEVESDEEMETETIVKLENLTEDEIREMYGQVTKFTPECLNEISKILDSTDRWKALPPLLELDYFLSPNFMKDVDSPTQTLLNFALAQGVSIYQIRRHLEQLNEFHAARLLDNMVLHCP